MIYTNNGSENQIDRRTGSQQYVYLFEKNNVGVDGIGWFKFRPIDVGLKYAIRKNKGLQVGGENKVTNRFPSDLQDDNTVIGRPIS